MALTVDALLAAIYVGSCELMHAINRIGRWAKTPGSADRNHPHAIFGGLHHHWVQV
jgi:hypothetical protein